MSEQARFQEWWESTGTNSVILRAQAWSAWQAAITTMEQTAPDPHIALMEAEHDDRTQPQPAEDPDEWVIQDRVPVRIGIDRITWHSSSAVDSIPPHPRGDSQGKRHGDVHPSNKLLTLRVWCRRRDLPKVEQAEQCAACDAPAEPGTAGCKDCNEYATAICSPQLQKTDAGHDWSYHEKQKPQPQKRMLRLWVDSDCNIHAGLKGDGDLELHYDHETRQFYTEEQP